jgi:histidinol phosphatase-like PHP family hydrolase
VDLLPQELSVFGLPSLKKYQSYVNKLREQYPSITLHCGIELGDYHLVKDFATGLIGGFDFFPILGSVHFLTDHTNVAIPFPSPLSTAQILDYYESNLRLVSECDIDVLAHLGVYKRYYNNVPDESFATSLIKDIFAVMIDKGIALELNFSGLFKPYASVIPEPHFIEIYRDGRASVQSWQRYSPSGKLWQHLAGKRSDRRSPIPHQSPSSIAIRRKLLQYSSQSCWWIGYYSNRICCSFDGVCYFFIKPISNLNC